MKLLKTIFLLIISILFLQCKKDGVVVKCHIANAAKMKSALEMVLLNGNVIPLGKAEADSEGKFNFTLKENLSPGLYRIIVGNKPIFLLFDGKEHEVTVDGDFNSLEKFESKVDGSSTCEYYVDNMKSFVANPAMPQENIESMLDAAPTAICAAILSFQTLPTPDSASLVYLKRVRARLEKESPNTNYAIHYAQGVSQLDKEISGAANAVKVGSVAPEIALPDPSGAVRKLSDLRGKMVLLDFWASWCRPCRMENPNVVKAYNRFKSKGFTVYSVSLDGVSLQNRSRMDAAGIEKALKEAKRNWTDAIKQDGLPWENHVSDLQQWDAAPAAIYGVQSIPQTFLIDPDGKIVAINPRGTLEQELEKYLQ